MKIQRHWQFLILTTILFTLNIYAQNPRLQAIHSIADPDLSIVDVYVSVFGQTVVEVQDIPFRAGNPMTEAIPITVDVGIAPGNSTSSSDVIVSFSVPLQSGKIYYGIGRGVQTPANFAPNPDGLDISLGFTLTDAGREASSEPGKVQFIFAHTVTDGPTIDLVDANGGVLVDNAKYGDLSTYISRTPGPETLYIKDQAGNTLGAFASDFSAYADSAFVLFLNGFLDPAQNQNGEAMGLLGLLPSSNRVNFTPVSTNLPPTIANAIPDQTRDEDFASYTVADLSTVFDDADSPNLTYSASADGNTIATISGSNLTLSSIANFSGASQVIVTADDGEASVSDTFQVTINPVNDAPVLVGIPDVTFNENSSTTLPLNDFVADVDNSDAEITFSAGILNVLAETSGKTGEADDSNNPRLADLQISIDPATHIATFSATPNFSGQFTVAITATDPGALSDSDTLLVTIVGVNDPPVVINAIPDTNITEDSGSNIVATNLNSVFDDPENDPLTLSVSSDSGLTAVLSGDTISATPDPNFFGQVAIIVSASDGENVTADTFLVTVANVNDPPVLTGIPDVTFDEDTRDSLDLDQYLTDIDNADGEINFTFQIIPIQKSPAGSDGGNASTENSAAVLINIDPVTHIATFSATPNFSDQVIAAFTATDPGGLSSRDFIVVTIKPVNDAPVVINAIPDTTILEDSGVQTLVANLNSVFDDVENNPLTFSATADSGVSAAINGNAVAVTPAPDFFGEANVIVSASDGNAATSDTFRVTVQNVNDAPALAGIPDINFAEDSLFALALNSFVSDIDNDTSEIVFSAEVIDAMLLNEKNGGGSAIEIGPEDLQISIDSLTNIATFTSTADSAGQFTVVFNATDPGNLSDSDTISVTVTPVNDPPVVANAIPDTTILEDSGAHILAADLNAVFNDAENTVLAFSAVSDSGLTAIIRDDTLEVTPAPDFFGNVAVIVSASDGSASVSDTFSVTVENVNDAPALTNMPDITFAEDSQATLALNPFVSDVDNDSSEIAFSAEVIDAMLLNGKTGDGTIEIGPADLQIAIDSLTNIAVFTSTADSAGQFTVVFSATDPGNLSDSDTILVTVSAVNDAPVVSNAIPDTTILEDSGAHIIVANIAAVFSDVDSDTLNYSVNAESGLTAALAGNALEITPEADFFGQAAVIASASDGFSSVSDTFIVTVQNVNDPPAAFNLLAPADSFKIIDPNAPITFVWRAAQDSDGDPLTYTFRVFNADQNFSIGITDTAFVFTGGSFWVFGNYSWTVSVFDGINQAVSIDTFTIVYPVVGGTDDQLPGGLPREFALEQNYPNPFNPSTTIRFALPVAADVSINIYNNAGQLIRTLTNRRFNAGYQNVVWDGRNKAGVQAASGVYFYRLISKNFQQTRKMLMMK